MVGSHQHSLNIILLYEFVVFSGLKTGSVITNDLLRVAVYDEVAGQGTNSIWCISASDRSYHLGPLGVFEILFQWAGGHVQGMSGAAGGTFRTLMVH